MHDTSAQHLNPWFSIWMQPRDTIQQIVDEDPKHMVLLLAILPALIKVFITFKINMLHGGRPSFLPLFVSIVAGLITSIIGLYIYGALTRWTGTWFDGEASAVNIRAAIAWSMVPTIFSLSLLLLGIALFGEITLTGDQTAGRTDNTLPLVQIIFLVLRVATAIWSFVIYLKMLSQVQGFSIWKALGNALVSGLILVAFILAIMLLPFMVIFGLTGFKM